MVSQYFCWKNTDDLCLVTASGKRWPFLAVVSSPLPSSHVVYPVFFLNSATKNNFSRVSPPGGCHQGRSDPPPFSDTTDPAFTSVVNVGLSSCPLCQCSYILLLKMFARLIFYMTVYTCRYLEPLNAQRRFQRHHQPMSGISKCRGRPLTYQLHSDTLQVAAIIVVFVAKQRRRFAEKLPQAQITQITALHQSNFGATEISERFSGVRVTSSRMLRLQQKDATSHAISRRVSSPTMVCYWDSILTLYK